MAEVAFTTVHQGAIQWVRYQKWLAKDGRDDTPENFYEFLDSSALERKLSRNFTRKLHASFLKETGQTRGPS